MKNQDYYIDLIRKELQRDISADELVELENWKKENASNRLVAEDLSKAWEISDSFASDIAIDVESDYKKVAARLDLNKRKTPIYRMRWLAGLAAGLGLIASVWYITKIQFHTEALYDTTIVASSDYEKLSLPDGSLITLFDGAELSYNKDFSTNRNISLKGKAFFNVARDVDHPFIVESDNFMTKVLGTEFLLDDTKTNQSVSLYEGKVSVQHISSSDEVTLLPGETAHLSSDRISKITGQQDPQDASWHQGIVSYQGMKLDLVIDDLERWYDTDISLPPSIKQCEFSGSLQQLKVAELLGAIAELYQAELEVKDEGFIIKGGVCS